MKKMLNEWKEFINENEGEDNRVREMTPAGDIEYFKMIMDNGDRYIAEYDPSSEEVTVYAIHVAEEELEARALRYIQQDLPYDQERSPEDEEEKERQRQLDFSRRMEKEYYQSGMYSGD